MKLVITGNAGYVGPNVCRHLRDVRPDIEISGFDAGYFAHCLTSARELPEISCYEHKWGDVRQFPYSYLDGVDTVVHLAAISNDPMGNQFEKVTNEINYLASVRIAEESKKRGVNHFVFASSCSMYGSSGDKPKKEIDTLSPLTTYAKSKVEFEKSLSNIASDNFIVTSLRFGTACGMSDRLRLDLVLNDFVACAISTNNITILSDGTPWRPLIDVRDMARAIEWSVDRPTDLGGNFLAVNIGADEQNYQIEELAYAVSKVIPNTKLVINKTAQTDKRSYRVDFGLFKQLAPNHQPQTSLEESIVMLKTGLEEMLFCNSNFRDSELIRLKMLEAHIRDGRVDQNLYRTNSR